MNLFFSFFFAIFLLGFNSNAASKTVVLGDVEGQWQRFTSFFERNEAFEVGAKGEIALKDGYDFVFMGDAVDWGPASRKIIQTLTRLKEKYPLRVHLLMGNRDTNKLRFVRELSEHGLKEAPNAKPHHLPYRDWLARNNFGPEYYNHGPTRLKWILEITMGAPKAFEYRREELMEENGKKPVSDDDVFRSFRLDLMKFHGHIGPLAHYLEHTQIAHLDWNNRALFVHGGLSEASFGYLPTQHEKIMDISTWIQQLNDWAQTNVKQTLKYKRTRSELLRYQEAMPGPDGKGSTSLIYGRNTNSSGNPELFSPALESWLLSNGIDTLVIGHTPMGEIPVVISNGRVRIVFVDNSYAESKSSSQVVIADRKVHVKARSPTPGFGTISYSHELGVPSEIGSKSGEGWVVAVENGQALVAQVQGRKGQYQVIYRVVPRVPRACSAVFP